MDDGLAVLAGDADGLPQDKISAYYSLVFPNFTYYLQTLAVTIGRRCIPSATTAASSSATPDTSSVDVDLGPLKSVSRLHAKIEYEEELQRFVLVVVGRNGAWVDGIWSGSGSRVVLAERSQIQIATRLFDFVLPPPPAPDDTPSPSSQDETRPRSPFLDGIRPISPSNPMYGNYSPPPSASPPSVPKIPPIRPLHASKSVHSSSHPPTPHGGKGKSVTPQVQDASSTSLPPTPRPQLSFPANAGRPKLSSAKPEPVPETMDSKGNGKVDAKLKPKGKVGRPPKALKAAKDKAPEAVATPADESPAPPIAFKFDSSNAYDFGLDYDDDDDMDMVEIAPRSELNQAPLPAPPVPTETPGASSSKMIVEKAPAPPIAPPPAPTPTPAHAPTPPVSAPIQAPTSVAAYASPPQGYGGPTAFMPTQYMPNPAYNYQYTQPAPPQQQDVKPMRMPIKQSAPPQAVFKSSPFTSKPRPATGGALTKAPATGPFGYASQSGPMPPRPPKRKKGDAEDQPMDSNIPSKPALTYAQLCYRAITALGGKATLDEINGWIMEQFEYYRMYEGTGWKNSVRHNLSSAAAFKKMDRAGGDRKGYFWSVHPDHEFTFRDTKDVQTQPVQMQPQSQQAQVQQPVQQQPQQQYQQQQQMQVQPNTTASPAPSGQTQMQAVPIAAPMPQVAQWQPQPGMQQHNPYYAYPQAPPGQGQPQYYPQPQYNAYVPTPTGDGSTPAWGASAWSGAAATAWGSAPQQWPGTAGAAWAASSSTPWATAAQPSPTVAQVSSPAPVAQSPLAVPSPVQAASVSPVPSPAVAAVASPSPAPAVVATETSTPAAETPTDTASLDPALRVKIIVGLVPSTASTSNGATTAHAPTAITVHDNSFYLDPSIFAHLDPDILSGLEGLGSQKALEMLQGYHTRYLEVKEAKGKARGTKKRGRGRGGAAGGASTRTRTASTSVEPTTPAMKPAVAAKVEAPSTPIPPAAAPVAPTPVPAQQQQPQPVHQMNPMMGWYGYGQQGMYPGYPYGGWQPPPNGYPQYAPPNGYPQPGAYPHMQPGQQPYYPMPMQHYAQSPPQQQHPQQPQQAPTMQSLLASVAVPTPPPATPVPVPPAVAAPASSGASASPIVVVDDSEDDEMEKWEESTAKRRKVAA